MTSLIESQHWCLWAPLLLCSWLHIHSRHAAVTKYRTGWSPGLYHRVIHDDVIKWKHFPRYWPFVRGNHRCPVTSPHKGQWRGALMFSLICVWINGWVNNREAGELRRYRANYYVTIMFTVGCIFPYSLIRKQSYFLLKQNCFSTITAASVNYLVPPEFQKCPIEVQISPSNCTIISTLK